MLRTFSWLMVPVMLLSLAPSAWADVVITKSGERVYGTVLTETPVGVSILEPNGLTRGFYADEVQEVRRDPATRTPEGIAAEQERDRVRAEAEWHRMEAEQARRDSFFHLGHQLTVGPIGESANTLLVGGELKYRLLIGKYLAAYVGGGYGTSLARIKQSTFDDAGTEVASKSVTPSAVAVPFGVELRVAGLYVGGGATYLMGQNLPTPKEEGVTQSPSSVVPTVVFGYQYQFQQGPIHVGPVLGLDFRYGLPSKALPTGFYGGGIVGGWTF